jgi:glycosyltransferase involved in cell wall biosynthesis
MIGLWHQFRPSPWGGGNQFMWALKRELVRQRCKVLENKGRKHVSAHILHAQWFDITKFRREWGSVACPVIHRIDGPIALYRANGSGKERDEECFDINAKFATVTVFQSDWSLRQNLSLGYKPIDPIIIPNAADPEIFHARGRITFSRDRKIRLISVSWSDNPGKGAAVYKSLEEQLDWSRYDYTFVGNSPVSFKNIRQIDPVTSLELAEILRNHDIFITASRNDPCSNSLLEALTCRLPAIYLNSGGHQELVKEGGLPFNDVKEIPDQLDCLVDEYERFQSLISVPRIEIVAGRYLEAADLRFLK